MATKVIRGCYGISVDHYNRNLRRDAKNKAWHKSKDCYDRNQGPTGSQEAALRLRRLELQQELFDRLKEESCQ